MRVTILERGREGQVIYEEGLKSITGYQEFGGGDVVAIVSMGNAKDWRAHHAWALDRRADILHFVAAEVIRQRAPGCSADIDEERGDILLRPTTDGAAGGESRGSVVGAMAAGTSAPNDAAWVARYADVKGKFALVLLAVLLGLCFLGWLVT